MTKRVQSGLGIPFFAKINGSVFSLLRQSPVNKLIACKARKIVSPNFLELWNILMQGEFDYDIWNGLDDGEKNFITLAAYWTQLKNYKLHIAISKYTKHQTDRLKLIEGAIVAGNMNSELVHEYISIIEKLRDTNQLSKFSSTSMINKIKRRFENLLTDIENDRETV